MDVPIDDLKAIFGDFEKNQRNQTKTLTDLFKILTGDKTLPSTNRANSFYAKLNPALAVEEEEEKETKQGKDNKNKQATAVSTATPVTAETKKTIQPKTAAVISTAETKKTIQPKTAAVISTAIKKEAIKPEEKRTSNRVVATIVFGPKAVSILENHFKFIGDKITSITGGLGRGFDAIKGVFKLPKKEASAPKGETKTPYSRQSVEVILPPKTRVVLEDILEGANVSLFDKVKPYLESISTAISKIKITDRDKKKDGMFGFLKDVFPLVARLLGPVIGSLGMILAGGAAAIGSVAVLINGLFDNGPLKGLKKLLGRGGLALAKGLIEKGITRLNKAVATLVRFTFGKKAVDGVIKPIERGLSNVFKTLGELPGKLFKGIGDGIKGIFGGLTGKVAGTVAKSGGKGLISRLAGTAGRFLLKGLKRLPLIGTLIGFGFAISRIIKGDFIGGLLDIASAIASAVPVVGTALSIAIDVFSAYRDTKTGGSEKAGKGNLAWLSGIKKWISERVKYIPIIGPLIDAVGAFKKGDYMGAIKNLLFAVNPGFTIITDLLETQTGQNTVAAAAGGLSSIGKFFSTIKDKLLGAILNFLPESILGVSIRSRVADMLGIKGYGTATDDKTAIANNAKTVDTSTTDTNQTSTDNIKTSTPTPVINNVKPAAPEVPKTVQPTQTGPDIGDIHDTLKEQNSLIFKMLSFNKQTANNTGGLLGTMNTPSKNVSVVNVTNNPTAFLTNPVRSTDFRSQMFS